MSSFVSPVAKETITKLQYLLQNTLYTYAEIISSLDPELSKEFNDELSNSGLKSQVTDSEPNPGSGEATNPESDLKENFIAERVERLGILNDQVQANVDLLPDSSLTRAHLSQIIEVLDSECRKSADELEVLFNKYEDAYNILKEAISDQPI